MNGVPLSSEGLQDERPVLMDGGMKFFEQVFTRDTDAEMSVPGSMG